MKWNLEYLPEAEKDLKSLSGNQRLMVTKALRKVVGNPVAETDGGYGKPLCRKRGVNLTNFFKIKLKSIGIRVVYKLVKIENRMVVVVIGAREDDEVYEIAQHRAEKHGLK